MYKDDRQSMSKWEAQEPPAGLFDRIISAIKRERELRQTKRLLFGFLFLLVVSLVATPLSGVLLAGQVASSGILYFISAAASDLGTFLALWQDFSWAILESLPLVGIAAFVISLGVSVFTLRLFLHRRGLLLGYFMHSSV